MQGHWIYYGNYELCIDQLTEESLENYCTMDFYGFGSFIEDHPYYVLQAINAVKEMNEQNRNLYDVAIDNDSGDSDRPAP